MLLKLKDEGNWDEGFQSFLDDGAKADAKSFQRAGLELCPSHIIYLCTLRT